MMPQVISFHSFGIELEGIVSIPQNTSGPFPGMVICHSFPFLGENMSSPSVYAIAQALDSDGIATLRFNFRGVGSSGGGFDNGKGEQVDLRAAVDTFRKWPNVHKKSVGVVGMSFGAVVALDALPKLNNVSPLVLISPTSGSVKRSKLKDFKGLKFVLLGGNDKISTLDVLKEDLRPHIDRNCIKVIEEADNNWVGHESQLAYWVSKSVKSKKL